MRTREAITLLAATAIFLIAMPLGYYTIRGSGTWASYFRITELSLSDHGYVALVMLMLAVVMLVVKYRSLRTWVYNMLAAPPFVDVMYNLSALSILLRHPKVNLRTFAQRRRMRQNTSPFTPREAGRQRVTFEEFIKVLTGLPPTKVPSLSSKWFVKMRGKCLYNLVRSLKPEVVVETGAAAGDSSAYMLRALQENDKGLLVSIDLPDYSPTYFGEPAGSPVGFLIPNDLRNRWKLELEDSLTSLPRVACEFEIDIFVHDSLHTYNHVMFECETVWPHLKNGGALLVHDVNQAFVDFAHKVDRSYVVWERYGALIK